MALTSKILAPFIAASIAAGEGEYDELVQSCVQDLAEDLQLNDLEDTVKAELDKELALSDDDFDDYLEEAANAVNDKEAVLLICLSILACDNYISVNELSNYFAFADILDIDEEQASAIFDDFVDEVDDLVIEVEDE
ncbi:MAG: hypothetical protein Q4C68_07775 [Moraxella sp.]|nr:hypothetical protein [Moraxella sp.]